MKKTPLFLLQLFVKNKKKKGLLSVVIYTGVVSYTLCVYIYICICIYIVLRGYMM